MITQENFPKLLDYLQFNRNDKVYTKSFGYTDLKVDFSKQEIIYPEEKGLKVNERQTCNFSSNENFVVFECIHRLLQKGYKPEHLELEPRWKIGHGASGGRADILVNDQQNKPLLLIECKTAGAEFENAWRKTQQDGDQLFSYAQQISETQYLCLYSSEFNDDGTNPLRIDQRIIAHNDNDRILALDSKLKSYATASDVSERFAVWRDTYNFGFTESGIFEENIQPYQIGKNKYTLVDDTKPIDASDKEGKYHQFRTILRKHNIARRENAFEVLVNLFLCKIVDEEENKDDLKFYWKGQEYDNYFDFVDRLQNLYQRGMDKFLQEKISYISNEQIDNAFWTVKNKRNATKKQIQAYFRELKFFSNSAFSFIDTYNEELFQKNAAVLREIVGMWQGLRLKTEEHNQFLGDMFEFFLDNSIKQSEGQFFTPLPICKFIIGSLPLVHKIENSSEPLKALDYACGAGHFLNEYAYQIKPLVEDIKHEDPAHYYENITGVEKEGRLAKVAKVAAFMYGQEQIKISEADALAAHPDIPQAGFDVLVANPPFAVEGFLQTLNDEDKERYQLIKETGKSSNTNNIQCFFLERIHHLMAPDGVVGVIVPSSILSNSDGLHIRTREVLLQFFDFVSIAELGRNTFGKTGTNTIVLFLRRKKKQPEAAEHYRNRVDDFFEGDAEGDEYQDLHLSRAYCDHIGVPYDQYIKLFGQTDVESLTELYQYDIFKDYRKDFEASTKVKNLKKSRTFKKKEKTDQQLELEKSFVTYLNKIEKDKLYYFILAHEQMGKVLIVNAPNDKKKSKEYLGYEWSKAKGNEGIKYYGGDTVNDIITPMFDPRNLDNSEKINTAIKKNFIRESTDQLPDYCHYARLVNILDLHLPKFKKILSLYPRQNLEIKTKYKTVRIPNTLQEMEGNTSKIPENEILETGKVPIVTQESGRLISGYTNKVNDVITDLPVIVFGDHNCTLKYIDFPFIRGADGTQLLKVDEENFIPKYFYYVFQMIEIPNSGRYERHYKYLEVCKIPKPPKNIQQQIITECEAIDKEAEQYHQIIIGAKNKIEEMINVPEKTSKLNQVFERISDVVNPKEKIGLINYIGLENIEGETGYLLGDIETDYSTIKSNKNIFKRGDVLYGKLRPYLNKVYLADIDGICSTDFLVLRPNDPDSAVFYKNFLLSKSFNSQVSKSMRGQQLPRTPWEEIDKIPAPSLGIAKRQVAEVIKLEQKISKARTALDSITERKNDVIKSHLH